MKKLIILLFTIPYFFSCSIHSSAEELKINSKHAILYNLDDNTILYEKASEKKTYVASLTKIMTTIVAIENIVDLNKKLTLTNDVFQGLTEANASVAGFRVGNRVTYLDLLMGTMLPSGADAARGLAINIAGSENNFVILMNNKAKQLGLNNTNFVNITGLDAENHYSTVKDIALLLKYALKNETFKKIYTTKEYTTTNGIKLHSTLKNLSNKINMDISNILGTKTGYTHAAGLCLSSIANYNGINYLLVTTGADYKTNSPLQLIDALIMYNYYSSNYGYHNIINANEVILKIPIKYSYKNYYSITSNKTVSKYLPNSFDKEQIKYKYIGQKTLSYKTKYLDEIGTINIIYKDEILDTVTIYLTEDISFSIIPFLVQTKLIYLIILLILISIGLIIKKVIKKQSNY